MAWLDIEDIGFGFPELFDGLERGSEAQGFELLGEVVGDPPAVTCQPFLHVNRNRSE